MKKQLNKLTLITMIFMLVSALAISASIVYGLFSKSKTTDIPRFDIVNYDLKVNNNYKIEFTKAQIEAASNSLVLNVTSEADIDFELGFYVKGENEVAGDDTTSKDISIRTTEINGHKLVNNIYSVIDSTTSLSKTVNVNITGTDSYDKIIIMIAPVYEGVKNFFITGTDSLLESTYQYPFNKEDITYQNIYLMKNLKLASEVSIYAPSNIYLEGSNIDLNNHNIKYNFAGRGIYNLSSNRIPNGTITDTSAEHTAKVIFKEETASLVYDLAYQSFMETTTFTGNGYEEQVLEAADNYLKFYYSSNYSNYMPLYENIIFVRNYKNYNIKFTYSVDSSVTAIDDKGIINRSSTQLATVSLDLEMNGVTRHCSYNFKIIANTNAEVFAEGFKELEYYYGFDSSITNRYAKEFKLVQKNGEGVEFTYSITETKYQGLLTTNNTLDYDKRRSGLFHLKVDASFGGATTSKTYAIMGNMLTRAEKIEALSSYFQNMYFVKDNDTFALPSTDFSFLSTDESVVYGVIKSRIDSGTPVVMTNFTVTATEITALDIPVIATNQSVYFEVTADLDDWVSNAVVDHPAEVFEFPVKIPGSGAGGDSEAVLSKLLGDEIPKEVIKTFELPKKYIAFNLVFKYEFPNMASFPEALTVTGTLDSSNRYSDAVVNINTNLIPPTDFVFYIKVYAENSNFGINIAGEVHKVTLLGVLHNSVQIAGETSSAAVAEVPDVALYAKLREVAASNLASGEEMFDPVYITSKEFLKKSKEESNAMDLTYSGSGAKITNLTGIKYFTGYTQYDFTSQNIGNLGNITDNSRITKLIFKNGVNPATINFSNLYLLQKLSYLDVTNAGITSITDVNKIAGLETLIIAQNQLTSILEIDRLFKLKYLDISENNIGLFEGIESLEDLETVYLYSNNIPTDPERGTDGILNLVYLVGLSLRDVDIYNNPDRVTKFVLPSPQIMEIIKVLNSISIITIGDTTVRLPYLITNYATNPTDGIYYYNDYPIVWHYDNTKITQTSSANNYNIYNVLVPSTEVIEAKAMITINISGTDYVCGKVFLIKLK